MQKWSLHLLVSTKFGARRTIGIRATVWPTTLWEFQLDILATRVYPESAIRHVEHALAPRGIVVGQTPPSGSRADGSEEIVFYVGKAIVDYCR